MMTGSADDGRCNVVRAMLEQVVARVLLTAALVWWEQTYGRQREEHRHRRNRLCTYQNCRHVSLYLRRSLGISVQNSQSTVGHEALLLVLEMLKRGGFWRASYPLSMTRAATSSATRIPR
jgi:hypothetical protein